MNRPQAACDNCTEWGLCVKECKFLTRYAKPKAMAQAHGPTG